MRDSTHVFYSNQIECLFDHLKTNLFAQPVKPFARRIVVVPSPAMKSWVKLQMASDPYLKIATGLEITHLDESIQKLSSICGLSTNHLNRLELTLAIESEIRIIIASESPQKLWKPLFNYLKIERPESLSRKSENRLSSLSSMLAGLFMQYGLYGNCMVAEWQNVPSWQQQLWQRIYHNTSWSYAYGDLSTIINAPTLDLRRTDVEVHVFSLSYIAKLHHTFLRRLSQELPINLYVLSPCQAFWSDLLTDRESHRLKTYWEKKGTNQAQQMALDEYLRDCNPLLANFGRLGREMALQIEESNATSFEDYRIPQNVFKHEIYSEFHTDDLKIYATNEPLTLLGAIQADLLFLRNPNQTEKISINSPDNTLQVHVATSRMREVQILYNTLLQIIDKHSKDEIPITPGNIVVMAPNINEYAPLIKAVFESKESILEAQIMDLAIPSQSPFIQGFLHILDLPLSRWDASSLLQLLEHPDFQRCHHFTGEDVFLIRDLVKSSGVRWGADLHHRNSLLQRDSCQYGMVEETPFGTWEHSFDRLLAGLAVNDRDSPLNPLNQIDALHGPLIGKWISLMRSLRSDLELLHNDTHLSLCDWAHYLRCLRDAYLKTEDRYAQDLLEAQLDAFDQAGHKLGKTTFPFSTIYQQLITAMNQPGSYHREHSLHAVRFCSMLPMRAIPAQVIAMLGMEEGAYPRSEPALSLNLLAGNSLADYSPSQTDYDRFLFLEALLSARKYIIINYCGYSSTDGKELSPSLLVTELLNYVDKAFACDEQTVYRHPHHPFDKSYFVEDSVLKSYSQSQYHAAQAYYNVDKVLPTAFLTSFESTSPISHPKSLKIDLKDLTNFARNPIKSYFNKTLGIYLENSDKRTFKNEEELHLSRLNAAIVKKRGVTHTSEEVLSHAIREELLPIGAFKSVAVDRIQEELALLKCNLEKLGISSHQIQAITLSEHVKQPYKSENGEWQLPALHIESNGHAYRILGTFSEVCPQGLIAQIRDTKSDVLKYWPQFLVFHSVVKMYNLPIEPNLVMTKDDKIKVKTPFNDNPLQLLEQYMGYYVQSQENVSPLIPEWVPHLLTLEAEAWTAKMQDSLTNPFQPMYNDELKWALRSGLVIPNGEEMVRVWKSQAELLFGEMYKHWYEL